MPGNWCWIQQGSMAKEMADMGGQVGAEAGQGANVNQGGNGNQGANGNHGGNGNQGARPPIRWTSAMSTFVLRRFTELVGQGIRTDKGFKEVHLNTVARNLSEFIGEEITGTQVYNHLRKWRQRWVKVCRLKDLSGATWDEDHYMIVLDEEHLLGHTKDHPKDAEFLNTPIENYINMQIIFGSGQATGRFAMGSNEALGQPSTMGQFAEDVLGKNETINVDSAEGECSKTGGCSQSAGVGAANDGSEDKGKGVQNLKRKRTCEDEYIMLGMTAAVEKVAAALVTPQHNEVHADLYESVMKTPGYTEEALMFALSHLLQNKAEGLCFVQMTEPHRVLWLKSYLGKHYFN